MHPNGGSVDKRFCRNKCDPVTHCGPIPVDEQYTQVMIKLIIIIIDIFIGLSVLC